MHKHQLYINLFTLTSAMAFVACSDEAVNDVVSPIVPEVGEKTPIVLSVGGIESELQTRAYITDGLEKTMSAFDEKAYIFMVMQSEYQEYSPADYLGTHENKYVVTRGDVAKGQGEISFTDNNKRYWDDAHGRSSQLSIWAYAQKGQAWSNCTFQEISGSDPVISAAYNKTFSDVGSTVLPWQTKQIYPAIREWSVSYTGYPNQQKDDLEKQDLLFSNNISYNSENSWPDNRLKFKDGKFPTSGRPIEMKFYHAMSKITINIIAGGGFKSDLSDFTLKNNTNNQKTIDKLLGFNTKGLFNIKDGEFQTIHESKDITSIPCTDIKDSENKLTGYQLEALIIPNIHEFMKTHGGSDNNSCFENGKNDLVMIEFTVDNNTYKITSGQLFTALSSAIGVTKKPSNEDPVYIPMEAGKNYVFTFTIGKKKIDKLTASLAPWENVAAELTPSNARIKLQLEERGEATVYPVDIYRAEDNADEIKDDHESYNWTTGYVGNKNVFKQVSGSWKLTTDWYWPNNQTYYHFRAIQPSETVIKTNTSTTPNEDYVELTSGSSYTDVVWGAPMRDVADNEVKDDFKFIYNTENGFNVKNSDVDAAKSQIYQAIGPTEDDLKLTLFHMMSDLTFNIKTTTDANKVTLADGDNKTKVQIYNYSPSGKVLLGTGKVIPVAKSSEDILSAYVDWNSVSPSGTHVYKYGVVPQALDDVQLIITTPDHNQYIVDLKDVKGIVTNVNIKNPYSETSSGSGKYTIDSWYPGFKYNYTFTLTKTGITNLSATVVDWEKVEADDQEVQIK